MTGVSGIEYVSMYKVLGSCIQHSSSTRTSRVGTFGHSAFEVYQLVLLVDAVHML